jgi:hypothetical protein
MWRSTEVVLTVTSTVNVPPVHDFSTTIPIEVIEIGFEVEHELDPQCPITIVVFGVVVDAIDSEVSIHEPVEDFFIDGMVDSSWFPSGHGEDLPS